MARTALKNRIHATLLAFGTPCPMSDLFGVRGRELLERIALPEPSRLTAVDYRVPSREAPDGATRALP